MRSHIPLVLYQSLDQVKGMKMTLKVKPPSKNNDQIKRITS